MNFIRTAKPGETIRVTSRITHNGRTTIVIAHRLSTIRSAHRILVVQDGRKRMPEQAQNFKFVPWAEVSRALKLP